MTLPNQIERIEYDSRWGDEHYSAGQAGYTPRFLSFMKKWAGQPGAVTHTALDLGCGNGFFSRHLCGLGCRVEGVDISEVGVQIARQACPQANFKVYDFSRGIPFSDCEFDLVWCSEVLEHLFAPLATLQEIKRVLRPDGLLLCTVPYHGLIKNLGIALFGFERHYDPTYPHIRFFTQSTLSQLVRGAGLQIMEIQTCGSALGVVRDFLAPTNILLAAKK